MKAVYEEGFCSSFLARLIQAVLDDIQLWLPYYCFIIPSCK